VSDSHDDVAPEDYAIVGGDAGTELAGCSVELRADGSVMLVVDGERLFRFASFDALLGHYDVTKGELAVPTLDSASAELEAAEMSAAAQVAAIHLRPRAEKTLAEERVVHAIRRVRRARARVATLRDDPA
jgi:hypothetical protein